VKTVVGASSLLDEEGGAMEQVIQRVNEERHDPIPGIKQPEIPYVIKLRAR
jgi:hypothetical protein